MDACSVHWARGGVMLWLEVTAAASVVPSTRGATRSAMQRGDGGGGRVERWGPGGGAGRHRPAAKWLWAPPDFGRQGQRRRGDRRSEDPGK